MFVITSKSRSNFIVFGGILMKDRDIKSATNLRLSRTNAEKRSLLFILL